MLTLIALPITTPPFIPLGETLAKPLMALPCAALLVILAGKGPTALKRLVTWDCLLLLTFGVYASLAGAMISARLPPTFFNELTPLDSTIRATLSLGIGITVYILFRAFVTNSTKARQAEFLICAAISVSAVVAILQFLGRAGVPYVPQALDRIVPLFVEDPVWTSRSYGLAFEPSWLASQLVVLLIPLSLSRLLAGPALGTFRVQGRLIRIEAVFLALGLVGVATTASRTGFGALLLMLPVAIFTSLRGRGKDVARKVVFVVLALALLVIPLAATQPYTRETIAAVRDADDPIDFVHKAHATARAAVWTAGWEMFLDHPIVGVGLGNAPRYFSSYVPSWALEDWEVSQWLSDNPEYKPTPKNLAIRLLAETGLIGAALYAALLWCSLRLPSKVPTRVVVLRNSAVPLLFVTFLSLDSFALPETWILLATISTLGRLSTVEEDVGVRSP